MSLPEIDIGGGENPIFDWICLYDSYDILSDSLNFFDSPNGRNIRQEMTANQNARRR